MRLRTVRALLAAVLVLALAEVGQAGINEWTTGGPYGGNVTAVAVSPNFVSDQTIYAGTSDSGTYKSTDGGTSWSAVGTYSPKFIAISPSYATDHIVYAANGSSLMKTSNGGESWTTIASSGRGASLALSPNYATDHTVFTGGGNSGYLYWTSNDGVSWGNVTCSRTTTIQALAVSPNYAADQLVYMGASFGYGVYNYIMGGVCVSIGGGGTVASLAASPNFTSDQTLFSSCGSVYKSTNRGTSWTTVNTGITSLTVNSLAVSPNYSSDLTVFAGSSGGVFKTTNGGTSWTAVNTGITSLTVNSVAVSTNFSSDHIVYAGTSSGGVFKTTNGGTSWAAVNTGIINSKFDSLSVSPNYSSDQTVFAGAAGGGTYKTTNGGSGWSAVNTGILSTDMNIYTSAISPDYTSDQTVYAGEYGGVYKTTNGGASWATVNTGITASYIHSLAISPNYASDQTVYLGAETTGVYKTTNGGASWTAVNTGITNLYIHSLAMSPNYVSDHTVYAGTNSAGVFKSTDGGANWTAMNSGITSLYIYTLSVSPNFSSDHTVYAGTNSGGVFKTTDGGASWTTVNTGITNLSIHSSAISPNYSSDQTVYAGTNSGGVLISTDGGANWTAVNAGLTNLQVNTLAISTNYASDHTIFAETSLGGVFSYTHDSPAPNSSIAAPTPGAKLSGTTYTVSGTAADNSGAGLQKVEVSTNGGTSWVTCTGTTSWSYSWTLPADGSYTIKSRATDNALNVEAPGAGVTVTVDKTAPVVSAGANKTSNAQFTQTATATDSTAMTYSWTKQAGTGSITLGTPTALSTTVSADTDGTYTLRFTATDAAGNSAYSDMTLVWDTTPVDITPPTSVITAPTNGATLNGASSTTTGTASDTGFGVSNVEVGITTLTGGGGASWTAATANISPETVNSLAVSPNYGTDQTVYAGTGNGVFKTTNGGASWTATNYGVTSLGIYSLAISPNYASDHTVYCGTYDGGVCKTVDWGGQWTAVNAGLPSGPFGFDTIYSLAISPNYASDQTVYAGTSSGGVYKTTNRGSSWTLVNAGLIWGAVRSLAISPNYNTDHTVFAAGDLMDGHYGTGGEVFKTTNGGTSWTAVNTSIAVRSLAVSPNYASDHTVFAGIWGAGRGLIKTTNGGTDWTNLDTGFCYGIVMSYSCSLAVSPDYASDQTVYACLHFQDGSPAEGGYHLLKTTNGGTDWTEVNNPGGVILSLAISQNYLTDGIVFAGTSGNGVIKSANIPSGTTAWHQATGTASWSYNWTIPAVGSYTIQSRATDNADNVETPGAGVTVTDKATMTVSRSSIAMSYHLARPAAQTMVTLTSAPSNITFTASSNQTWLTVSPASGTTPSAATITINPAGLTSGNYSGTITFSSPDAAASKTVTVSLTVIPATTAITPENQHTNWDANNVANGCNSCHITPSRFLSITGFNMLGSKELCTSCHNAASNAHDKGNMSYTHPVMVNATTGGCKQPVYGNITAAKNNNMPFAKLIGGKKMTCSTCHNAMGKKEDNGRTWETTTTTDKKTYYLTYGGWANYGRLVPVVYRTATITTAPTYSKSRKSYIVNPSEYTYDETAGSITFKTAQSASAYIYVTLDFPYLRASSYQNRLCLDCHRQSTHKGANCLDCHQAHSTSNRAGVKEKVRTTDLTEKAVKFLRYTGVNSFADGDTTYDGICEVCHTKTKYCKRDGTGFANHSSGANYSGKSCVSCHTHSSGFAR